MSPMSKLASGRRTSESQEVPVGTIIQEWSKDVRSYQKKGSADLEFKILGTDRELHRLKHRKLRSSNNWEVTLPTGEKLLVPRSR